MPTQSISAAAVFSLQLRCGRIGYTATLQTVTRRAFTAWTLKSGSCSGQVKLRFMFTRGNSRAVVFALRIEHESIGYLPTKKMIFNFLLIFRSVLNYDGVHVDTLIYLEMCRLPSFEGCKQWKRRTVIVDFWKIDFTHWFFHNPVSRVRFSNSFSCRKFWNLGFLDFSIVFSVNISKYVLFRLVLFFEIDFRIWKMVLHRLFAAFSLYGPK